MRKFCGGGVHSRRLRIRLLLLILAVLFSLLVALRAFADEAPSNGFQLASPGISGDFCYDLRASVVGYGPSYTLGTFGPDQMFEIKGAWIIFPDNGVVNKLGAGLAVSIPKALKAAGCKDVPDWFNTSVGVMVLVNFQDNLEISPGVYCTLLKFEF